jgi:hypothetical protein
MKSTIIDCTKLYPAHTSVMICSNSTLLKKFFSDKINRRSLIKINSINKFAFVNIILSTEIDIKNATTIDLK